MDLTGFAKYVVVDLKKTICVAKFKSNNESLSGHFEVILVIFQALVSPVPSPRQLKLSTALFRGPSLSLSILGTSSASQNTNKRAMDFCSGRNSESYL